MAGRLKRWRTASLLVGALVLAVHLWLVSALGDQLERVYASAMPSRLQVTFVQVMKPSAPVVRAGGAGPGAKAGEGSAADGLRGDGVMSSVRVAASAPTARRASEEPVAPGLRAESPSAAASQPPTPTQLAQGAQPVQPDVSSATDQQAADGVSSPEPHSTAASGAVAAGLAAAPAEASSAAASNTMAASLPASGAASSAPAAPPPFEWPASTRLSYVLTGNFRGEVHGSAEVQWIRDGPRYQVHLDVTVGMPFAPLFTRRISSDGRITTRGLAPLRYDEETKMAFDSPRRQTLLFDGNTVVLADGRRMPGWPGVQDSASQFVQLTWLFTTQPALLRAGAVVDIPLALPRNVDRWTYDVVGEETLATPFGALPSLHLKPRMPEGRAGALAAEMWIAPTLAYLPVRIRVHQNADTYIDLLISRLPEMAAR